jgi:hypothetical protein
MLYAHLSDWPAFGFPSFDLSTDYRVHTESSVIRGGEGGGGGGFVFIGYCKGMSGPRAPAVKLTARHSSLHVTVCPSGLCAGGSAPTVLQNKAAAHSGAWRRRPGRPFTRKSADASQPVGPRIGQTDCFECFPAIAYGISVTGSEPEPRTASPESRVVRV